MPADQIPPGTGNPAPRPAGPAPNPPAFVTIGLSKEGRLLWSANQDGKVTRVKKGQDCKDIVKKYELLVQWCKDHQGGHDPCCCFDPAAGEEVCWC
jgi:hypothetical protein